MSITAPNDRAEKRSNRKQSHLEKKQHRKCSMQQGKSSMMHGGQQKPTRKGPVTAVKNKHGKIETVHDGERYVVVITNVENDFARVHQKALPQYCCLNEQHNRSLQQQAVSATVKGMEKETSSTLGKEAKRRQCRYTVTPRTETRSVEVAVYGKADGDVSSVYLPHRTGMREKKPGHQTSKEKAVVWGNGKEVKQIDGVSGGSPIKCVAAPVGNHPVFTSLEDMVMALRHAPYFTHPPKFLLNLPGKEEGEILRGVKSRKRPRNTTTTSSSSSNDEGKEEECQGKEPTPGDAKDFLPLLQSTVRQAEMITAVATTSARMHTKELCEQLKEIPGFITCWMLYPQHFRVLFASRKTLFHAKELLDQFEVDGHVRVTLTFSDGAAKAFAEHLASVESTV
ncbi:hypothetical protein MOQ_002203 [Trypanosoma cruzi marinkellei]|uniref:Uncharacterized protein n=1 Tax=Trypanosoma cruzi marinkellei TaxID=85056 RepID=K2P956_TRYCR|nr:hypothetical protein MOQ_002203 [Trypanosoma cruzi marinkellei]